MLIDIIFQTVKTFVNTEGRGNFSPEDFNLILNKAIHQRNEEYFSEINRFVSKENRGNVNNSLENIPDRIREKVSHYLQDGFLTLVSDETYDKPEDCRYIDLIEPQNSNFYEVCKDRKEFTIAKEFASERYPIYRLVNNQVKIFPQNTGKIEISYLRTPKYAKWTYNPITELFNPDANDFQDADIHVSEKDKIIISVLSGFGINLKETDIQAYASREANAEFNQNNIE